MVITTKWVEQTDERIVSEDGFVVVNLIGDEWQMTDSIDEVNESFDTRAKALDAGARILMVSELGQFNAFARSATTRGEIEFNHVFVSVD